MAMCFHTSSIKCNSYIKSLRKRLRRQSRSRCMQVKVVRLYVGPFFTSLDMQGVSISLLPVDSDRLARLDSTTQASRTNITFLCFWASMFPDPSCAVPLHKWCSLFLVLCKSLSESMFTPSAESCLCPSASPSPSPSPTPPPPSLGLVLHS